MQHFCPVLGVQDESKLGDIGRRNIWIYVPRLFWMSFFKDTSA
jgi:hypothetical protein